ncbi:hypothetical protein HKBW3S42_01133, partial [Candidatus Hakubella thermalkaliphila]
MLIDHSVHSIDKLTKHVFSLTYFRELERARSQGDKQRAARLSKEYQETSNKFEELEKFEE